MARWVFFLPVVALTVFVGYLAMRLGAVPSDTQIITRYAERYVATVGNGGVLADCAATPHPNARMIINCHHDSGEVFSYVVGHRGQLLLNEGPSA